MRQSGCHAPSQEEYDGEFSKAERGVGVLAECLRWLQWINKPLQPDFEAKVERQT